MSARSGPVVVVALVAALVAACAGAAAPPPSSFVPPSPSGSLGPSPTAEPSPATPGPPSALLRAEGADADVTAELGGYTWLGAGSDSPWLPGAPAPVTASGALVVGFDRVVAIESWSALLAPAADTTGSSAAAAGAGAGSIRLTAPGPGAWTLAVQVQFAGGLGDAAYFWRLDAR